MAGDTTTMCHIWDCVMKDGSVRTFTDNVSDITFEGKLYTSAAGFMASNISTNSGLNVDNLEVSGGMVQPTITETEAVIGLWDNAHITLRSINYNDLTMGAMYLRSGTIGIIRTGRTSFTAELRGMMQPLQQNLLEYYAPACRAQLGDARCGLPMATYIDNGSVTGVIDDRSWNDTSLVKTTATVQKAIASVSPFTGIYLGITNATAAVVRCVAHGFASGQRVGFSGVTGMTQINGKIGVVTYIDANKFSVDIDTHLGSAAYPPYYTIIDYSIYTGGGLATLITDSEYYTNGIVTWLTGANAGLRMEVKAYSVGRVELFQSMPFTIALGDTYTITAGCDHQLTTCKNRFNNVINFRGEPHVSGNDALLKHA
jgi:hypothetical protein